MNKLTDNDKNWGPFTLGRWHKSLSAEISSGDEEEDYENYIRATGFGWALRMQIPQILNPTGKYGEYPRQYGFSLSDMGNGYDFFQIYFGPQTYDSSTRKSWCKHLTWKQWDLVRTSLYRPDGSHFADRGKEWDEFFDNLKSCPKAQFEFEDYDGEKIVASCMIEEHEWRRGEGWFKWLKYFYPRKIRRSLDLKFSAEVGPEKGSYKGGTTGHGIEMLAGETPEEAFRRYCYKEHNDFRIKFIGPVQMNSNP